MRIIFIFSSFAGKLFRKHSLTTRYYLPRISRCNLHYAVTNHDEFVQFQQNPINAFTICKPCDSEEEIFNKFLKIERIEAESVNFTGYY